MSYTAHIAHIKHSSSWLGKRLSKHRPILAISNMSDNSIKFSQAHIKRTSSTHQANMKNARQAAWRALVEPVSSCKWGFSDGRMSLTSDWATEDWGHVECNSDPQLHAAGWTYSPANCQDNPVDYIRFVTRSSRLTGATLHCTAIMRSHRQHQPHDNVTLHPCSSIAAAGSGRPVPSTASLYSIKISHLKLGKYDEVMTRISSSWFLLVFSVIKQ